MLRAVLHMVVSSIILIDQISRICWTFLINLLKGREVCEPKQGTSWPSRMPLRDPSLRTDFLRTTSRWEPIANIIHHQRGQTTSRSSYPAVRSEWCCSSKISSSTINKTHILEQTLLMGRETFWEVRRKISLTNQTIEVSRWAISMIVTSVRCLVGKVAQTVLRRRTEEIFCPNQEETRIIMFSIPTIWPPTNKIQLLTCICNNKTGMLIKV